MGRENSATLLPGLSVVISASGFYRFEDGIEVQRIAELHELLAQMRNMNAAPHVYDHRHREHRGARVRGRVAARGDFRDVDAARGEEPRQPRDDAALIQTHDV